MNPLTLNPEFITGMDKFVEKQLYLLKPVQDSWQPSDMLPNMAAPGWEAEIRGLRERSQGLPDDLLVILVGNLVTEEALPSYQTWLNRPQGFRDETGSDQSAWAIWTRSWTAEENRHGELLNKYLYLTGRVNMRSMEVTTQHLIRNGFDVGSDRDPYKSVVYAAFQERATKISHANTGKLAEKYGDEALAKVCSMIASDEARHEEAYKRIFGYTVENDPTAALPAFAYMMRQKIAMPARLMSDGGDQDLFNDFAVVAQRSGVYTIRDYASIMQHLVEYWRIAGITGLTGEAAQAQEYLCRLPEKYMRKAGAVEQHIASMPKVRFSWIFDRNA